MAAGRPLVIAGTASGVGKTTLTLGLMGAFRRRGLRVAPFKVGPDYIDPGYHEAVAGTPSRNLDTWLTSPGTVVDIYRRGAAGSDLSVVEGVMGLFDGRAGGDDADGDGSTAEVARLIDGVVVLVVDCARMARSLAPLLAGFAGFDSRLRLGGVVLNNVGSANHARMLESAAGEAGMKVLGVLPRRQDVALESRHLGLVPAGERGRLEETLELMARQVAADVDLEALTGLVRTAPPGRTDPEPVTVDIPQPRMRLAVARDQAFSFYYADSLEALQLAGAELIFFSPLNDSGLPACDGIYLGGGFPEIFAAGLEANRPMREAVRRAADGGLPVYAECGGLVYLSRSLAVDGRAYSMAGAIPAAARMTGRRRALGYVEARARRDSILLARGDSIRGHEFHWSSLDGTDDATAYDCYSARAPEGRPDGFVRGNLLASYVHVHFAGRPGAARRFIDTCARAGE